MANMAAMVVANYFDSIGFKYRVLGQNGEAISIVMSGDNISSLEIGAIFSENNDTVKLVVFELAKFPANKVNDMYKVCNDLNKQYNWAKFYVNEEDGQISVEDDAVIQLDSAGEETFRCIQQLFGVCNIAYPNIMRGIYV